MIFRYIVLLLHNNSTMEIKAYTEKSAAHAINAKRCKYFISAGHRGKGTGASGNGIDEGSEVIWLRDKVCDTLTFKGYNAIKDNSTALLRDVVAAINAKAEPDDFSLDIHFNAASPAATGVEAFVREGARVREKVVAIEMVEQIAKALNIKNRGVKTDSQGQHSKLAMCNLKCDCMLIEVCFISNGMDAERYKENRMVVVQSIVSSLLKNYGL